jgi:large subunit ribosomal protein L17
MRHGRLKAKLGVKTKHRKALLRNLVKSLVVRRRIQTTFRKAKVASSFADSMVELAKRGDLHSRRLLIARLGCADTANSLIKDIAPHFKDRQGGYTRVLRLGKFRAGDNSEMALLEFTAAVQLPEKAKKPAKDKKASVKELEAPKPKKAKTPEKEEKAPSAEEKKKSSEKSEKKESEKKGGFLGALRKFLKGEDEPGNK